MEAAVAEALADHLRAAAALHGLIAAPRIEGAADLSARAQALAERLGSTTGTAASAEAASASPQEQARPSRFGDSGSGGSMAKRQVPAGASDPAERDALLRALLQEGRLGEGGLQLHLDAEAFARARGVEVAELAPTLLPSMFPSPCAVEAWS